MPDLDQQAKDLWPWMSRLFMESGSWTPVLFGSGTAGSFTYAAETGAAYTRIGNMVYLRGQVRINAIAVAPTTNMYITGLPFTAATRAFEDTGNFTFATWQGITFPANYTQLGGYVLQGESRIGLIRNGSGQAAARVQGSEISLIGSLVMLRFGGAYEAAS